MAVKEDVNVQDLSGLDIVADGNDTLEHLVRVREFGKAYELAIFLTQRDQFIRDNKLRELAEVALSPVSVLQQECAEFNVPRTDDPRKFFCAVLEADEVHEDVSELAEPDRIECPKCEGECGYNDPVQKEWIECTKCNGGGFIDEPNEPKQEPPRINSLRSSQVFIDVGRCNLNSERDLFAYSRSLSTALHGEKVDPLETESPAASKSGAGVGYALRQALTNPNNVYRDVVLGYIPVVYSDRDDPDTGMMSGSNENGQPVLVDNPEDALWYASVGDARQAAEAAGCRIAFIDTTCVVADNRCAGLSEIDSLTDHLGMELARLRHEYVSRQWQAFDQTLMAVARVCGDMKRHMETFTILKDNRPPVPSFGYLTEPKDEPKDEPKQRPDGQVTFISSSYRRKVIAFLGDAYVPCFCDNEDCKECKNDVIAFINAEGERAGLSLYDTVKRKDGKYYRVLPYFATDEYRRVPLKYFQKLRPGAVVQKPAFYLVTPDDEVLCLPGGGVPVPMQCPTLVLAKETCPTFCRPLFLDNILV